MVTLGQHGLRNLSVTKLTVVLAAPGTVSKRLQGALFGAVVGGVLSLPFGEFPSTYPTMVSTGLLPTPVFANCCCQS